MNCPTRRQGWVILSFVVVVVVFVLFPRQSQSPQVEALQPSTFASEQTPEPTVQPQVEVTVKPTAADWPQSCDGKKILASHAESQRCLNERLGMWMVSGVCTGICIESTWTCDERIEKITAHCRDLGRTKLNVDQEMCSVTCPDQNFR